MPEGVTTTPDQVDYGFEKLQSWIDTEAKQVDLTTLAKNLKMQLDADLTELTGKLDQTGNQQLAELKKSLVERFDEAKVLFEGEINLLEWTQQARDAVTRQELLAFADGLDDEFADLVREAQGEEGDSFAFKYAKDFFQTNEKGEKTVFGMEISKIVNFFNQIGFSLGWIKNFVPEIAQEEAKAARPEVEKSFKKTLGNLGENSLSLAEVKLVLAERDKKLASTSNLLEKTKVNYEMVVSEIFETVAKKFGTKADLQRICGAEKLSLHELILLKEADEAKVILLKENKLTLSEFLANGEPIAEKVAKALNGKSLAEITAYFLAIQDPQKSEYQASVKDYLGKQLKVEVVSINSDGKGFVVKIGKKERIVKRLEWEKFSIELKVGNEGKPYHCFESLDETALRRVFEQLGAAEFLTKGEPQTTEWYLRFITWFIKDGADEISSYLVWGLTEEFLDELVGKIKSVECNSEKITITVDRLFLKDNKIDFSQEGGKTLTVIIKKDKTIKVKIDEKELQITDLKKINEVEFK